MLRLKSLRSPYIVGFLPLAPFVKDWDVPKNAPKPEQLNPGSCGIDRIKKLFRLQEDGRLSQEVSTVLTGTMVGMLCGMGLGGVLASYTVPQKYMDENVASRFDSHLEAKKDLQTKVTIAFGKGAISVGWRMALFCFLFQSTATLLNAYQRDAKVMSYTLAGTLTGMAFKFHSGVKATISGALTGSVLGTIAGVLVTAMLSISGITMHEIYDEKRKMQRNKDKEEEPVGPDVVVPQVKQTYDELAKGKS